MLQDHLQDIVPAVAHDCDQRVLTLLLADATPVRQGLQLLSKAGRMMMTFLHGSRMTSDCKLHCILCHSCMLVMLLLNIQGRITTLRGSRPKLCAGPRAYFKNNLQLHKLSSRPLFPYPSLPLFCPPLRSRPLLWLGDLGERFSSPSGSARPPNGIW